MKHVIRCAVLYAAILHAAASVAAESESQEAEANGNVHINADSTAGSALAEAARLGGSVVISSNEAAEMDGEPAVVTPAAKEYTVKEGDTLWDISNRFFGDPYVWPMIWSYNLEITNPNWIYPGDVIRLFPSEEGLGRMQGQEAGNRPAGGGRLGAGGSQDGILLRNQGFIDKAALKRAGELVGAHKEVMWLSQHDEAYVEFPDGAPKIGDQFTAFDILGEVESIDDPDTEIGKLVEIRGFVHVISFDRKSKIARVVIDESFRPIPRGTYIGKVRRPFDVVPAVVNDRDLKGHIIAELDNLTLSATHHVVFVDRGAADGVRNGNRFFAVEQRDGLRRINNEPNDHKGYPVEVIAEMRVVEARPHTATCLITAAIRELEIGQKVELRKGY